MLEVERCKIDPAKNFPTNIYLQKSASIRPRTILSKLPTTCISDFTDAPHVGEKRTPTQSSRRLRSVPGPRELRAAGRPRFKERRGRVPM